MLHLLLPSSPFIACAAGCCYEWRHWPRHVGIVEVHGLKHRPAALPSAVCCPTTGKLSLTSPTNEQSKLRCSACVWLATHLMVCSYPLSVCHEHMREHHTHITVRLHFQHLLAYIIYFAIHTYTFTIHVPGHVHTDVLEHKRRLWIHTLYLYKQTHTYIDVCLV